MITETQARELIGSTAYTQDGDKLGKVGQLFLDDTTGQPEFVTVNTGLFGMNESFVPVAQATFEGDRLTLPFSKDQVKGAPNVDVDAGGHLSQSEEDELYRYYGMSGGTGTTTGTQTGTTTGSGTGTGYQTGTAGYETGTSGTSGEYESSTTGRAGDHEDVLGTRASSTTGTESTTATGTGMGYESSAGHDTSGPNTDEAMTRSEERLDVDTRSEEAGRARLRKYVTTETETVQVPVTKERAVVETEPITGGNVDEALDGPAISEEEHEVVLHEEKPVVGKTAEPVERVRLGKETVTDEETVTEEVRKENIEVEGDVDRR